MEREYIFIGPSRREWIFGLVYLLVHLLFIQIILVEILLLFASIFGFALTDILFNVIWLLVALVVLVLFLGEYLRNSFSRFLEYGLSNLTTVLGGYGIYWALSLPLTMLLYVLLPELTNPNNDIVMEMAARDFGPMFAIGVLLAPVVEEIFFRGAIFAPLRKVNRLLAYAVSSLLFGFWHVVQPMIFDFSPLLFVTMLIYIPAGVALARVYERSGSIWTPIALHMLINAVALTLTRVLPVLY